VHESHDNKNQLDEMSKYIKEKKEEFERLESLLQEKILLLNSTTSKLDVAMIELDQKRMDLEKMFEESKILERKLSEQIYITKYFLPN
jgi:hypothetical protein